LVVSNVKQRIASANEEDGNYILTAFLGFQAPTGAAPFTNRAWVITPTLAGGKGGAIRRCPIPTSNQNAVGVSIVSNVAFQYRLPNTSGLELELFRASLQSTRLHATQLWPRLTNAVSSSPTISKRRSAELSAISTVGGLLKQSERAEHFEVQQRAPNVLIGAESQSPTQQAIGGQSQSFRVKLPEDGFESQSPHRAKTGLNDNGKLLWP
jgi:hypothetical protein